MNDGIPNVTVILVGDDTGEARDSFPKATKFVSVEAEAEQGRLAEEEAGGEGQQGQDGAEAAPADGGGETGVIGAIAPRPPGEMIVAGPLGRLRDVDFGPPLHSLVIVGEMHEMEEEMLKQFMLPPAAAE